MVKAVHLRMPLNIDNIDGSDRRMAYKRTEEL
jgi:hypothetical protein